MLKCERCEHEWHQKGEDLPKTCPKCKSPYWQKPMSDYWKAQKKIRDAKREEVTNGN